MTTNTSMNPTMNRLHFYIQSEGFSYDEIADALLISKAKLIKMLNEPRKISETNMIGLIIYLGLNPDEIQNMIEELIN